MCIVHSASFKSRLHGMNLFKSIRTPHVYMLPRYLHDVIEYSKDVQTLSSHVNASYTFDTDPMSTLNLSLH